MNTPRPHERPPSTPTSQGASAAPPPSWIKNPFVHLGALGLLLAFSFQGSRGLFGPDETRYAECAREMLATDDWLTPRLNGRPHLSKPPMAYWAIAAGMKLFGVNEWGARLVHGVAFAATILVVAAMGRVLWDTATGLFGGLIYATSPIPFVGGALLTTDSILTFWTALAILCYCLAYKSREQRRASLWITAMWLAFGFTVMTKGHVGLLFLLPVLVFHFIEHRSGRPVPRLVNVLGWLGFLLISVWWFVLMCVRHEGTLAYFLKQQVGGHIALNVGEAHHTAWYKCFTIYGPTLLLGMFPWSIAWFVAIWRRVRGRQKWPPIRGPLLLLALWIALPLLVFFVALSRMPFYLMPLFPALALATAFGIRRHHPWIAEAAAADPRRRRALAALAVWCLVLVAGKAGASYLPIRRNSRILWERVAALMGSGHSRVFLMRRPDYGQMFYARQLMLEVGVDEVSLRALFQARETPAPSDSPAQGRRTIFLLKERCLPMPTERLRSIGKSPRPVKLAYGWAALVVDEPG